MATHDDVRRVARTLPGTTESAEDARQFAVSVRSGARDRGFAWTWMERVEPKRPRVPNLEVLAVRVASLEEKDALLSMRRPELFTEPHYHGYPAVLIRLADIEADELEDLLIEAWRSVAPKRLVKAYDVVHPPA
ncbi:MAG: hypothetical protein U0360_10700 [Dehalococcoidia bacterium]